MKKTLALVLALAMVFSTVTVAFAEGTIGGDAQICADLGMLKGSTGTVDAAYTATAPTRIQAAVMFLRLKGLEAEAMAFTGAANFADADKAAWAKPIMAYLKANPQLGWMGDGTNFDPMGLTTAQAYYKVMLEALGYKQTTAEVVGDFAYADVIAFAAGKGLTKVAAVTNYTVNDLAIATVEALKANMKDGGKTLVATLVAAGKIDNAKAVAAGLIAGAVKAEIDDVVAVGSAVVEVIFVDDVDASAANAANFAIEGLTINAAAVAASDRVRLDTAVMTSGKLYTLKMGEQSVQFTGIAKVSGGPEIETVVGEDVEEVVINFTKNIDLATGSNVANYAIAGVEIQSASVDADEVTLTTVGLKNKTKYTVKVTNVKSVDGVAKKSDSETFTTKYDLVAPKIDTVNPETNQRVVVTFNEKITKDSAENLANYSIKVDDTDGAELEIKEVKLITTGDFKNKRIELVTEAMEKREDYKLSITNIADRRKVANVMTRPATKDFEGKAEDETSPVLQTPVTVLSPTTVLLTFTDASRIDEATALDTNNYDLEDLDIESITTVKNVNGTFKALLTVEEMETGESYDLTVVDVLDEFGNALKEKTVSVKGIAANFASERVVSAIATDENTIEVKFTGEVDEDTAENIAFYSIDEEVGAPTDAEYDVDTDTVTLTVNDLVNGFENVIYDTFAKYDLVVDGVKDLAGNSLYYKVPVDTNNDAWSNAAPELEDIDVLYDDRIALSFDEKVEFQADTRLVLAGTDTPDVELTAFDYSDDFTVVEFSGALVADKTYTIVEIVYGGEDGGITDLIGNPILETDIEDDYFTFEATSNNPAEGPEVDSYEQVNATTIEVTMNKFVDLVDGDGAGTDVVDNGDDTFTVATEEGNDFVVSVEDDVVTFVLAGGIEEDTDYTFDFRAFVADKHAVAAQNADELTETVLAGEYTDEDAPYVEEVVAKDRWTIKVTFSENMPMNVVKGSDFTLMNYDLDKEIDLVVTVGDDDEDNIIYLTVEKPLEARYEYELTIADGSVLDFAGLDNEDAESFYFDGSNLANKDLD
jgi:hypothetical protein